jgi:peptidyl-dipeptidase A
MHRQAHGSTGRSPGVHIRLAGAAATAAVLVAGACGGNRPVEVQGRPAPPNPVLVQTPPPRVGPAEAAAFVDSAEARLLVLSVNAGRASWVQSNFITDDTEILAAQAQERLTAATVELAKSAARFDGLEVPYDVRRKLTLLKLSLTAPAPSNPAKTATLTRLAAGLEGTYGKGRYCRPDGQCPALGDLENILATSRDPMQLLDAWAGWRTVSAPMREDFTRFVALTNEGARELGFADAGALWRSNYDMAPADFAAEVDRLWGQVRPLYEALHCHVRAKLNETYGSAVAPASGPIPAHLLGNMWAQTWGNIYPLVAPGAADPGYDLTERLNAKNVDARGMAKYAEGFFTSLGFAPLPGTFWERSLFTKPADRDVVCHASAWDVDEKEDLRIKMCIRINAEDFQTIHHEVGHNFYQRAYKDQPYLYHNSANDGFHEALGDAIALSVTPSYLVSVGLIDREPDASKDVGLLMRDALEKVAFLPFGLLVDQWRWKVFSGEITPADYNAAWWALRERYQGVKAPLSRSERDFDPGAKYHVAANVPYTRYFLAAILQFQFHRALCQAAGYQGPLNRCSIHGNAEAGRRLRSMMEMGASRPWPDALEALTGQRQMDATAIIDYFAPLKGWLDQQNRGRQCGWT